MTRVPTHLPRTTFFGTQYCEESTGSISLVGGVPPAKLVRFGSSAGLMSYAVHAAGLHCAMPSHQCLGPTIREAVAA
jgi:hypothetical protein